MAIKTERSFLFLALSFGLLFVFLTPPFQVPDEDSHFYRAYDVSLGHITGQVTLIPKTVMWFTRNVSPGIRGNPTHKQSIQLLWREVKRTFHPEPVETVSISNLAVYSPIPYLPQAAGILVGRLIHLPPIFIFYLGRLANLLAWIALVYLAVRITPIHPRLLAAVALLPMSLFLAASFSPDALTNAISFLWIAFALRLAFQPDKAWKRGDWLALAGLVIALALCKSIYVLLAGLILLLPWRKEKNRWVALGVALGVIVLALLAGWGWLQASIGYGSAATTRQYGMPAAGDIGFIIAHPFLTAQIFARSIYDYFSTLANEMAGVLG